MLVVDKLEKRYAARKGEPAGGVFGVSFEVTKGELFTLLGPSGCGKTTTLRCIAGLEIPDIGLVRLAGQDLFDGATGATVAMYDRDIGMVFQSYAIWPHMSVFENAAYPLRVMRRGRPSRKEIDVRVSRVLEMVGLGSYKGRSATQLSGGQQQRLALARALVREPKLLLLDEPLSNLDAQLREQMRSELKRIQAEWGVTTVYVTHDQAEAMAISDRIAVMNQGLIVQVGAPHEIYERPRSEFVAQFIGRTNMLRGKVSAVANGAGMVATEIGTLRCNLPQGVRLDEEITFVVRPEHVVIGGSGSQAGENIIDGHLVSRTYLGEIAEYTIATAGGQFIIARAPPGIGVSPGEAIRAALPTDKLVVVRA